LAVAPLLKDDGVEELAEPDWVPVVPVDAPVLEALPTELPVELPADEVAPRDEVLEPVAEVVELRELEGAAATEKSPVVE